MTEAAQPQAMLSPSGLYSQPRWPLNIKCNNETFVVLATPSATVESLIGTIQEKHAKLFGKKVVVEKIKNSVLSLVDPEDDIQYVFQPNDTVIAEMGTSKRKREAAPQADIKTDKKESTSPKKRSKPTDSNITFMKIVPEAVFVEMQTEQGKSILGDLRKDVNITISKKKKGKNTSTITFKGTQTQVEKVWKSFQEKFDVTGKRARDDSIASKEVKSSDSSKTTKKPKTKTSKPPKNGLAAVQTKGADVAESFDMDATQPYIVPDIGDEPAVVDSSSSSSDSSEGAATPRTVQKGATEKKEKRANGKIGSQKVTEAETPVTSKETSQTKKKRKKATGTAKTTDKKAKDQSDTSSKLSMAPSKSATENSSSDGSDDVGTKKKEHKVKSSGKTETVVQRENNSSSSSSDSETEKTEEPEKETKVNASSATAKATVPETVTAIAGSSSSSEDEEDALPSTPVVKKVVTKPVVQESDSSDTDSSDSDDDDDSKKKSKGIAGLVSDAPKSKNATPSKAKTVGLVKTPKHASGTARTPVNTPKVAASTGKRKRAVVTPKLSSADQSLIEGGATSIPDILKSAEKWTGKKTKRSAKKAKKEKA